jgi:addiction module HigA family antidote
MEEKIMPQVHPGEILEEAFLDPLGMTAYQLSKAICVMPPRVYEIVHGERAVSS